MFGVEPWGQNRCRRVILLKRSVGKVPSRQPPTISASDSFIAFSTRRKTGFSTFWRTSKRRRGLCSPRGGGTRLLYPIMFNFLTSLNWEQLQLVYRTHPKSHIRVFNRAEERFLKVKMRQKLIIKYRQPTNYNCPWRFSVLCIVLTKWNKCQFIVA